jgi:hypothetical protein
MLFAGEGKIEPEKNPAVLLLRRFMPITNEFHGQRFFVGIDQRIWATPLFVVLLVIETTDVIFAVDSIPAIFAITLDPFIVYTSNIFAILGLRALYFLLAGILEMFRYLKVGLSFVLCFVGFKMMLVDFYKIPIGVSLGAVAGILAVSILASLVVAPKAAAVRISGTNPSHDPSNRRPTRVEGVSSMSSKKARFARVAMWLAIVAVVLVTVKWRSITSGPSADDAIVAIRVAQRDLFEAKKGQRGVDTPKRNDAESALNLAWALLKEKRYEDAILVARKASHSSRGNG